MLKRLYVHNFRCLENFELLLGDKSSALLIGKNGTGKSTVSHVLGLLQGIGRGTNRVGQLVKPTDFTRGQSDVPMRFELDVQLDGHLYQFRLALELPARFKELRVLHEAVLVDGEAHYTRDVSKVSVATQSRESPAEFSVDWHLIALPIIHDRGSDPLFIFKRWLERMIILAPIPSLITGESDEETLDPLRDAQNLGAWFAGLIAHSPSVYQTIDAYLRNVLPDLSDIKNPLVGSETRSLRVYFRADNDAPPVALPFAVLSDGEKCFFIAALVLAANDALGSVFCFWDGPDSHLSLDEVGHFVIELRRAFMGGGQMLMTSHNAETIRKFSDDTTLVLYRRSHLEPTRIKSLEEIGVKGDLITAITLGEVGV